MDDDYGFGTLQSMFTSKADLTEKMNTQIEAIERIVDAQERNCAVVFFLFFSRFEYALKRAGYVTRRKNGTVEADWKQFAGGHPELMQKALEDKQYSKAFKLLQTRPPKKQIVNEKGQLDWKNDNHDQEFNLARAVVLLKRIRNNLFWNRHNLPLLFCGS